ncbi:MAG: hypothetical protein V3U88_12810 [Methylococcales bacterium]
MNSVRLLTLLLFISPTVVMAESTSLSDFNACHDFSNDLMVKLKKDVVKEMAEDEFNQALMVVMENCHQLMQENGRVAGASGVKSKAVESTPDQKATANDETAESSESSSENKQEDWFTRFILSGERPNKAGNKRLDRRGKY